MRYDYWRLSAVDLAQGIARRDFSSADVVGSVLERIRARNPHLNAITVDCSEEALADAQRCDAAVRRNEPLGAASRRAGHDQRKPRPTRQGHA